jgi:parvulin-like peptidyl-prolyl isomerase
MIVLWILSCGKKAEIIKLDAGTPAYELGKQIASVLPMMDPDSNRILVTTDDFLLSAGEVLHTIHSFMGNRTSELQQMTDRQLILFIRQTTKELAEKKLILNTARRAKVKASSAEIDSILNMNYQRAGGKEVYMKFLNDSGLDFDFMKNDVEESIIISSYLDKIVKKKTRVTDEQVQEAYEKYLQDTTVTVRHILLLTKDKSATEKKTIRRKIQQILVRARKGEDFSALAGEFSEDPGSKDNGGLYEDFTRGDMIKPFEDAAFSVPIGQISDIVETQYGYHILKVIERKKNDRSLEEMRDELTEELRKPEERNAIPSHIEELKKKEDFRMVDF